MGRALCAGGGDPDRVPWRLYPGSHRCWRGSRMCCGGQEPGYPCWDWCRNVCCHYGDLLAYVYRVHLEDRNGSTFLRSSH